MVVALIHFAFTKRPRMPARRWAFSGRLVGSYMLAAEKGIRARA